MVIRETARLLLRPPKVEDLEPFVEIHEHPEVLVLVARGLEARLETLVVLEQFADVPIQCAQGADPASSRISANINVGPDCYANQILADSAAVLTDAIANDTGRFDASDLMPGEVGAGSFWTGMVQYMQEGPESLSSVLEEIESSWPSG